MGYGLVIIFVVNKMLFILENVENKCYNIIGKMGRRLVLINFAICVCYYIKRGDCDGKEGS